MDSSTITTLARAPHLLVISDFDGTIADLTTDAYNVPVNTASLAALTRLAGMPNTSVAILSGRHLEGLARVCDLRAPIIRAGSHGNESSLSTAPTAAQRDKLDEIEAQIKPLLDAPGAFIERKPFQRVAHTAALKKKDPKKAEELLEKVASLKIEGTHVMAGKSVVEFSVTNVTKGTWIEQVRGQITPDVTVFVGDDVTDEEGFKVLGASDVGVKVGEGETAATERLADTREVGEFYTALADARAAQLEVPRDTSGRFEWVAGGLGAVAHQITDWSVPTPCTGWSARDVIRHLNTWVPESLGLEPVRGDDPVDEYFTFVEAIRALLDEGNRKLEDLVRSRLIADMFIHTWDLAQAAGVASKLDENFAAKLLTEFEKMDDDEMVESGMFDPPVEVSPDASVIAKLMAATGREPIA